MSVNLKVGLVILAAMAVFFYPVWLKGLVPMPADFTVGIIILVGLSWVVA